MQKRDGNMSSELHLLAASQILFQCSHFPKASDVGVGAVRLLAI